MMHDGLFNDSSNDSSNVYDYTLKPYSVYAIMDMSPFIRIMRRKGISHDPTVNTDLLTAVLSTCDSAQADALIRAGIDPDKGCNEGLLDELVGVQKMVDKHLNTLMQESCLSYKEISVVKFTQPLIAHVRVTVYGYELSPF